MFFYRVFGLIVASDMLFLQLVKCEATEHYDILIEKAELSKELREKSLHKKFEFGLNYSWLINLTCQIEVIDGNKIRYALTGSGNPDWLQTYLLGFGMSMLALQRNMLPIHCSVVSDEEGAVLIAGESGAGKSTLTTAFLKNGYSLMADDMAWADGEMVYPAFPYQKLCRDVVEREGYDVSELIYIDEEKDKFLAPYRGNFCTEPKRMKGFLWLRLTGAEQVEEQEITGFDRLHVYVGNLFLRKLMTAEQKYAPYIGQIGLKMAANVPVLSIARPIGKDTAREVVSAAMEWVNNKKD